MSSIVATELSNYLLNSGAKVAIRWQPKYNSSLAAIRHYDIDHAAGYSAGTGGAIRAELFVDVSGEPAEPILANGKRVLDPQFPDPSSGKGRFPLTVFDTPIVLSNKSRYWIVFTNDDPNPVENNYSLDLLRNDTVLNQVPNCQIYGYDQATGIWSPVAYLIPSPLLFIYANGLTEGLGWIEYENNALVCGSQYGFFASSCQ